MKSAETLISEYQIRQHGNDQIEIRHGKNLTQQEIAELTAAKPAILAEFAARVAAIAEKADAKIDEYQNGKTINARYHDGEYLSGYQVTDTAAIRALQEIGYGDYVDMWGYHVGDQLGESFTVAEAAELLRPVRAAEAQKKAEQKAIIQAKYDEAERTGNPVEIYRMMVECSDPREECSADLIVGYAMPNGTKKENRTHTY